LQNINYDILQSADYDGGRRMRRERSVYIVSSKPQSGFVDAMQPAKCTLYILQ